jgi:hypothetical protein
MNTIIRRYVIEFGASMAAYAVVLVISLLLVESHPHAVWRVPVVLAPLIPTGFALVAFLRYLHDTDEMQQRLQLEAIGFSFGATGMLTFAYGFLQNVGFPQLSWIYILPLMIALWGIGSGVAARRYR